MDKPRKTTLPPSRRVSYGDLVFGILSILLAFVFAVVVVPCFLPISLIFRLYRHKLHKMIRKRTNNEVLIASGDDAVWFQDSKENYAIINSMMFLKGKFNIESFRDLVMEKIITAKNERNEWLAEKCICYPSKILHRYVWRKEEKFDIKDHVYVWDGDIPKTQTEMEALLSHLSSIPFSEGKSPWEMVIVPCYKDKTAISQGSGDEDDVFPLVFRVHHSIGDGVSLMRLLMQQLMDVKPKKGDLPQRFASKDWLWRAAKAIVTGPAMIIGRICWPPDHHALHGPGLTGQKLFTWSHNLDLDLIKRMKNATGTTVNDILMTCLAGAFHEYFRRHASKTPPDLLTYVPVDIRSHTAELVLDNQFALVFLKLPLDIEDRMTRLSETKARMDRIKMSAEPVVNALTIRYLMARFPNWLTRILFDNVASKCSLVLSNVPGPQEPLYIGDLKLEQMVFWPPQRCNVGMGISILSYNGTVKTGIMMDKRLSSNPKMLLNEFEKEINAMAAQLNVLKVE